MSVQSSRVGDILKRAKGNGAAANTKDIEKKIAFIENETRRLIKEQAKSLSEL